VESCYARYGAACHATVLHVNEQRYSRRRLPE